MKKSVGIASVIACAGVFLFASTVNASDSIEMHRMYNKVTGEHFYTSSAKERDNLKRYGWEYEGIGWYAPKSGDAVYRLYNKNNGDHHYTTSAGERDSLTRVGWNYEGVGWYSSPKKEVPLYRAYNPNARTGSHNYTVSRGEQDFLVKTQGWRDEGIGWYGVNKDNSNNNGSSGGGNSGNGGGTTQPTQTNKTALKQAIDKANSLNGNDYVEWSWNNLQSVLASAKNVYNDTNATQTTIDSATNSVNNAINSLYKKPSVGTVDKTALNATIDKTYNAGYVKNQFSELNKPSSQIWTDYESAMTKAEDVKRNSLATQAEVDSANSRLINAVNTLEAVPKLSESQFLNQLSEQVFNKINLYRASMGKTQLGKDLTLQSGSDIRAKEAVLVYDHTRPDGTRSVYAIPGYPNNAYMYNSTLESLGKVGTTRVRLTEYSVLNTSEAQLNQWKESSGHNNIILQDRSAQNGVMSVASAFVSDNLVVVQLFNCELNG